MTGEVVTPTTSVDRDVHGSSQGETQAGCKRTSVTISDTAGRSGLPRGVVAGFPEQVPQKSPVKMQDVFTASPSLGGHLTSIQPHSAGQHVTESAQSQVQETADSRGALRSHCLKKKKNLGMRDTVAILGNYNLLLNRMQKSA